MAKCLSFTLQDLLHSVKALLNLLILFSFYANSKTCLKVCLTNRNRAHQPLWVCLPAVLLKCHSKPSRIFFLWALKVSQHREVAKFHFVHQFILFLLNKATQEHKTDFKTTPSFTLTEMTKPGFAFLLTVLLTNKLLNFKRQWRFYKIYVVSWVLNVVDLRRCQKNELL